MAANGRVNLRAQVREICSRKSAVWERQKDTRMPVFGLFAKTTMAALLVLGAYMGTYVYANQKKNKDKDTNVLVQECLRPHYEMKVMEAKRKGLNKNKKMGQIWISPEDNRGNEMRMIKG